MTPGTEARSIGEIVTLMGRLMRGAEREGDGKAIAEVCNEIQASRTELSALREQMARQEAALREVEATWYDHDEGIDYCRGCGVARDTSDKQQTAHGAGKVTWHGVCIVGRQELALIPAETHQS